MELLKRKVKMFRCHLDPGIGPMPRNAFMLTDPNSPIEFAQITPIGIYIKMKPIRDAKEGVFREHLVPYANLQSVELMNEEADLTESVKIDISKSKK